MTERRKCCVWGWGMHALPPPCILHGNTVPPALARSGTVIGALYLYSETQGQACGTEKPGRSLRGPRPASGVLPTAELQIIHLTD